MPATQVSPSLRRRLSDDARELLRSALGGSNCTSASFSPTRHSNSSIHSPSARQSPATTTARTGCSSIQHLSIAERLQNFRGQIRLELPDLGGSACVRLRIAVSDASYLLRYQVESLGAEVSVFNKAGSVTSWITAADGQHTQLRTFLHATSSPRDECAQITSLVDILEMLDLFDVFRASLSAHDMPRSPCDDSASGDERDETYRAMSDKNAYVFVFDRVSGRPLLVTQSTRGSSHAYHDHQLEAPKKLGMVVEDYVRSSASSTLEPPLGIKSDVELMVDTAMTCFSQWSYESQQRVMAIFDVIDKDSDGSVSGEDVYEQLVAAGQSEHQSTAIVLEMTRLLCDSADPAEEFAFYKFCGFWITMLADGFRVSDPANEHAVCTAFDALFLGARSQ